MKQKKLVNIIPVQEAYRLAKEITTKIIGSGEFKTGILDRTHIEAYTISVIADFKVRKEVKRCRGCKELFCVHHINDHDFCDRVKRYRKIMSPTR